MFDFSCFCCLSVAFIFGLILYNAGKRSHERMLEMQAAEEAKQRALKISDIDNMSGLDFEHYVARLLKLQGFTNIQVTKGSGDFGIDITAVKSERRYAIQVKRQQSNVSRRAISDAVAGKAHLGYEVPMVITNSYFSKAAQEMSISTGCQLVDRDLLTDWVVKYQRSKSLP